jgi:hypothetical protein
LLGRVKQDTIPVLEIIGRWLTGIRAISQPIECRLADSFESEVRAPNLNDKSVVLQLAKPLLYGVSMRVEILCASAP